MDLDREMKMKREKGRNEIATSGELSFFFFFPRSSRYGRLVVTIIGRYGFAVSRMAKIINHDRGVVRGDG